MGRKTPTTFIGEKIMLKKYAVKNPAIRETLTSKFITRLEADAIINSNRLVERNASTGNIQQASVNSARVIGANQNGVRAIDDMFDIETGLVYVEAGTALVAGQKVKAGTNGKAIALIDSDLISTEIASVDGGDFTIANQPSTDTVTIVSDSALDTSQTVTLYGVDSSGDYITEELAVNGTTEVDTASALWSTVSGITIDAVCSGIITVSEASASATLVTLASGVLSAGIETITDGYAYNKIATLVADGASTTDVVIVHEATDGADETNLVLTLNGTTEVALSALSYKINTLMVGGVASTVNLDLDVAATEDAQKLVVGKVVVGASSGEYAIVLI